MEIPEVRQSQWTGDDTSSGEDFSAHAGSFAEALSRSVESSVLLRSRSPWVVQSPASYTEEHTRQRSLSHATDVSTMSTPSGRNKQRAGPSWEGDNSQLQFEDSSALLDEIPKMPDILPPLQLSSLSQSIFNATNLLVGVGLLSLPYAMRLSGWLGLGILLFFAAITNHTGKLLGEIMDYRPSVRLREGPGGYTLYGFHDMGFVAMGEVGRVFISALFILETFGYCCVYFIIEGENLAQELGEFAFFQQWTREDFMCMAGVLFLPSVWLRNLSWLSYFSAVGVLSSTLLLVGVVTTGFFPDSMPPSHHFCHGNCTGSVMAPSPTVAAHPSSVPVVVGLIMVGFAGHAVFPTLKNDMADQSQYNTMVDVTYVFVVLAYSAMAAAGYLMFGDSAQQQVTLNLGDNVISHVTVWIVVLNPISKFALDLAPIALGLENYAAARLRLPTTGWLFTLLSVAIRTILVALALIVVILVPDFAMVLGVLGSACAFTVSVAFPTACYLILFWPKLSVGSRVVNALLLVLGVVCAVVGTVAAVLFPDARA